MNFLTLAGYRVVASPWEVIRHLHIMIPDFDENGYLPPGTHSATIDEVARRFGNGSDVREAEAESLRWLLPMCGAAGISRLVEIVL